MISNIFAMPGSPAFVSDDVARAMASEALDLATQSQPSALTSPWIVEAALATGVATTSGDAATFVDGAVVTDGGGVSGSDISIADIALASSLFTYDVSGGVAALAGVPPAASGPPHVGEAGIGYQLYSAFGARTVQIVENGPALATGDKIFLRFPAIKGVTGAAADAVSVTLTLDDGGPGDRWMYSPEDGSFVLGSSDDITASIGEPTIEFSDNGDGTAEMTFTWAAAATVAAGWRLGIGAYSSADQTTKGIEFDDYQVTVGDTSPHGSGGVAGGYGLVVADPSTGSHRATLPFVLAVTTTKPQVTGPIMQVVGTTGGQAGDLIVDVRLIEGGKLQLGISEDAGTTTYTATVPAGAWAAATSAEVAVRIAGTDVELFINGVRATGLILAASPTAINSYSVASNIAGDVAIPATITAVRDANGINASAEDPPIMTEDEYEALVLKPSAVDIIA